MKFLPSHNRPVSIQRIFLLLLVFHLMVGPASFKGYVFCFSFEDHMGFETSTEQTCGDRDMQNELSNVVFPSLTDDSEADCCECIDIPLPSHCSEYFKIHPANSFSPIGFSIQKISSTGILNAADFGLTSISEDNHSFIFPIFKSIHATVLII